MNSGSPAVNRSPTFEARRDQMFPTLSARDVARMRRFGSPCHHAHGEHLYETGKLNPGMFVVLSGTVRITHRDGHGHDVLIIEHHAGSFSGEVGQLSERRSLVDATAVGDVDSLLIPPAQLRGLLIAEADLGERIMRALILRRVGLIETGAGGPILIGSAASHDVARLRNFLHRNGAPHLVFDPATDADAQALIERYAPAPGDMPLVVCPDGTVLRNPPENMLAAHIGMLDASIPDMTHDVTIVGAGPAGLAAAVYAASEGLSVLVIDARAFGGQAGASARIENYLGFPTGISGLALTARAYTQAQKFGARMLIPAEVRHLDCSRADDHEPLVIKLADGRSIRSRTVVIATGARYRRPECGNLQAMEGHGVWYWASPIEARMSDGEEVVLVGGGNSAGQAAVFLSAHAAKVWMLVRGDGLAASMSRYLIDRILATPNIALRTRTQIVGLAGTPQTGVESVTWRNRDTREQETHAIRNVFMFLGADPTTEWLKDCNVALDGSGFVQTGVSTRDPSALLETSVSGVFAIGDVRAGSVKRVGSAIGEGAAVVAQIHAFMARQGETSKKSSLGMSN